MFKKSGYLLPSIIILSLFFYYSAYGAVSDPQNLGGKSLRMGGSVVALADDLMSALYTNPAGLIQLDGMVVDVGSVFVFNRPHYKSTGGYSEDSYFNGTVPWGGYSNKLSDKLAVGIGIFSTLGNGFVFKDYTTGGVTGDLKNIGGVLTLAPTMSYMVSQKLYLGLQMHIGYGISENNLPTPAGYLKTDGEGFGIAPVIGLLYKPTSKINLGLKWKGPMKTSLEGDADLFTTGGQKIHDSLDTDLYWPQMIEYGMAYKFRNDFLVTIYGKWTDWSHFEKSELKFRGMTQLNSAVISDMRDGIRFGAGAEYKTSQNLSFSIGYLHDEYSVGKNSLSPFLVDLTSNMVSCGSGFKSGNFKLELMFAYVSYIDRKGTGAYPGTYSGDGVYGGIEIGYQFQ